jgi:hypothetical protein
MDDLFKVLAKYFMPEETKQLKSKVMCKMYVLSVANNVSSIAFSGSKSECLDKINELKSCGLNLVLIREDDLMELWCDGEIQLTSESENELLYGKHE